MLLGIATEGVGCSLMAEGASAGMEASFMEGSSASGIEFDQPTVIQFGDRVIETVDATEVVADVAKKIEPITVSDEFYESLGESEIKDSHNNLVGTVKNKEGYLDMWIRTKGTAFDGRGNEIYQALYEHALSQGEVKGINGIWSSGEMGSNLRAFNRAIQSNMTPEEAAFATPSGTNARDLGFDKVQIHVMEGTKGGYNHVSLTFTKQ